MADRIELTQRLGDATSRLRDAEADREAAMRERDEALRALKADGATYADIHAVTGMSVPTITKALRRQ